jgi:hypothetical protein
MKISAVCGFVLLGSMLCAAFVPFASASSRILGPSEAWTVQFEDAKKGDVIHYRFAIGEPDGKDRLVFWIEGPDKTRYLEMININSGNGSFEVASDGVWTAMLQNYNWVESIDMTADIYLSSPPPQKEEAKDTGYCASPIAILGMLAVALGASMVLMAKRRS